MKTEIYITGHTMIPKHLKQEKNFECFLIENPYNLRSALHQSPHFKIVVAYLPFLEVRHFDLYNYLQKTTANMKTIFIVNELSDSMKLKVKSNHDFIVLWKTEEQSLVNTINTYLEGQTIELRQDRREPHEFKALLSPSMLPAGSVNKSFQPILGGAFENLSPHGSCLKIKAPFYNKKDFVNLSYQDKNGEFINLEGQVRWTKWNEKEQSQELGVQFLTR